MRAAVVQLGEVASAQYGSALKEADRNGGGQFTVFGSSGSVGRHDKVLVGHPTIIIGRKGSVGEVTYAPKGGWPIDTTYYLELKDPGRTDLRYLYWALLRAGLGRRAITTSIPGLNREELYRTRIPFPPLAEQQRIAAMLDKADAVRRKRRESLRLLDEFLRSAFVEMFGDPVRNGKGWEVVRLNRCLAERPMIGTITPAAEGGEFKVVRVGQLGRHEVGLDQCGRVTVPPDQLERFVAREGDVLLARAIGSAEHLGKASVMQAVLEPIVFDSHVMRLRMDHSQIRPSFLWHWLQTPGGRRMFLQRAGRTAVQFNVNATQVREVRIPLPPVREQDAFLAVETRARAVAAHQEAALQNTDDLFDSLAQRTFAGGL